MSLPNGEKTKGERSERERERVEGFLYFAEHAADGIAGGGMYKVEFDELSKSQPDLKKELETCFNKGGSELLKGVFIDKLYKHSDAKNIGGAMGVVLSKIIGYRV